MNRPALLMIVTLASLTLLALAPVASAAPCVTIRRDVNMRPIIIPGVGTPGVSTPGYETTIDPPRVGPVDVGPTTVGVPGVTIDEVERDPIVIWEGGTLIGIDQEFCV